MPQKCKNIYLIVVNRPPQMSIGACHPASTSRRIVFRSGIEESLAPDMTPRRASLVSHANKKYYEFLYIDLMWMCLVFWRPRTS